MDKAYQPHDIERRIYERWESHGWFAPQGDGAPFCIVIPPPNVTGTLHLGHAFQQTLMDALTRYHRMRGDQTLWQPGTDHAGIATQMVVERQLNARGLRGRDLGREAFVAEVWKWKEHSGGTMAAQMRRLGDSLDWARDRFTMDAGLTEAVTEVFVRLHEEGLLYRGKRLVNWDPVLLTALSDLEVEAQEESGHLWHLRYPLASGKEHLVVATTRPETLLGDVAVAVHPEDERYKHLIGQQLTLPLTGRTIPVIGDAYVDPAFGSGCVKITPAHDFNDYEIGQRHSLAQINIFTPEAALNDAVPERFRGLDRFEARKRIVTELDAAGLLERIEDHKLMVPRGDRSQAVLEPYLTDQWYVKIAPLAAPALAAVEEGRTRFVPENWSRTYFEWMRNIKDWCVSRQLWWGHRIPAWYDAHGTVYVGRSEAEVRQRNNLGTDVALRQDEDVLDTWFSSALWPFSTLGWPHKSVELKSFYPTSVLITGFDIIFFWVARMMMMGLKFMGEVPFRDVYITGLVLDEHGQKMSKMKGNVIDPLDVIDGIGLEELVTKRTSGLVRKQDAPQVEKHTRKQFPQGIAPHGTDALRFYFAATASHTRELRFDLARVAGYRNFCNKLWNAARFVIMQAGETALPVGEPEELSVADRWIRSQLGRTVARVESALAEYRFDYAATSLYDFAWYEMCDWYLELTKPVMQAQEPNPRARLGTQRTLLTVLEGLTRALHPFMPFITEEIWQRVAPLLGSAGLTVMKEPYPTEADFPPDEAAEEEIAWIKAFILGVRQIRGEMNIAPSRKLPVLLSGASKQDKDLAQRHFAYLSHLAGIESVTPLKKNAQAPQSATVLLGEMTILVPLAGLIDPAAEAERLKKRIAKAQDDQGKMQKKLSNESFVKNAPPEVVAGDRERAAELEREITKLTQQLEKIRQLGQLDESGESAST